MNTSRPDENEDRQRDHPRTYRSFDLQSRPDDAVEPQLVTVFPQHADEPSDEWVTIDAEFAVPVDETL